MSELMPNPHRSDLPPQSSGSSSPRRMSHPPKPRRTHTLPPTTPLSQQVGGHSGVQVTEDESLLLKPAQPCEIAFYQFVRDVTDDPNNTSATGVHVLRDWIPAFIGLLNLEGKLADPSAGIATSERGAPAIVPISETSGTGSISNNGTGDRRDGRGSPDAMPTRSILVLQNLLYGYEKPCVLDVKLGTVLYDENASEEKKTRMIKKARETSSFETGVRLTGFQVYSNHAPDPVVYGKDYGYGLKPEQLMDGIRNFFPCSTSSADNSGLPVATLLTLLTSLYSSLVKLRTSMSSAHVRIVGGSALIIYEGDWDRAIAASDRGGAPGINDDEVGSQNDEDDEIEVEIDERGEIAIESLQGVTSETSSTSSDTRPRLYTVSLIDFAHTRFVPGEGPDQGLLKGTDTLIRLVDERRREVVSLVGVERA